MFGAESMDAKLIEDPAEEYEAGDGDAREPEVADRWLPAFFCALFSASAVLCNKAQETTA